MKVYLRDVSDRHFSLRGLPVMDVLKANHVRAVYVASKGFLIRHEHRPDVEAIFHEAGHRIVELRVSR